MHILKKKITSVYFDLSLAFLALNNRDIHISPDLVSQILCWTCGADVIYMRFPPGTQVWVRCDDSVWWPAKVKEMDAEMRAFLSADEDCCVEFYHSPGELYPLVSSDDSRVCVFHAQPQARTAEEEEWLANEEVKTAASKAVRDHQWREGMHPSPGPPPLPQPASLPVTAAVAAPTPTPTATPFSAAELRNIQALLGAVGPEISSRLRQQLQHARVSVASRGVQKKEASERKSRKRQRAVPNTLPSPFSSAVQQWRHDVVMPLPVRSPPLPPLTSSATLGASTGAAAPDRSNWEASPRSYPSTPSDFPRVPAGEDSDSDGSDALPFVPAARRHVLEVLRHEVFDNPARFVLSPVFHFVELLGAVAVENRSLTTTLPSPRAVRETPANGFSPHRRVLLVPLTEDYDHTTGWMVPMELDGVSLSMSLYIDGALVPLPPNWQLSPAKEASAVKTAVTMDVTDAVLGATRDLFSLSVVFSGDVEAMEMWRGVIACVLVEDIGLSRLGERIVSTYRKPRLTSASRSPSHTRGDRSLVDITEASVKVQCPITTLTMEIPVRSVYCEHLQCMELAAVLIQSVRQNVWNCPLCNAAMKPEDICVNYRLKDWIASHPQQLSRVEFVVETTAGTPLKVVYRAAKERDDAAVEVVDDDD
ncbi:lorien protein [Leptomonas pyrrhocoris]|uniref:Lorien protein n=1 Tax=Leptomonas pyrrhocoris TaxID=157538 RepID=A0A0M9G6L4_LEPPY|nr:lorien protein [Leptomonas pyrrhocoris]KPA83497.1 lorien protein [Leptomonas pyrrhocoris]|eukprot:XP_015661936.1 lorien protein [Leptomonas pyrrhocoris]